MKCFQNNELIKEYGDTIATFMREKKICLSCAIAITTHILTEMRQVEILLLLQSQANESRN